MRGRRRNYCGKTLQKSRELSRVFKVIPRPFSTRLVKIKNIQRLLHRRNVHLASGGTDESVAKCKRNKKTLRKIYDTFSLYFRLCFIFFEGGLSAILNLSRQLLSPVSRACVLSGPRLFNNSARFSTHPDGVSSPASYFLPHSPLLSSIPRLLPGRKSL